MNENKNLFHLVGDWWETTKSRSVQSRETNWKQQWLPTPGNLLVSLSLIFVLLWAQSVGAVPFYATNGVSTGTIAYQGRLASAGGAPLTQTIGMEFRLYTAATGGAPLWTEQWTGSNSVQVSDGLFNVMLGSLTPISPSVLTGNDNLFLGITVGTDSEMSPRVQLGSVPFAVQALTVPDGSITLAKIADDFKAPDADKLNGKDSTEFALVAHTHDGRYYTKGESDNRFSLSSHNHDGRYYTKGETDTRFVNANGDTMTGILGANAGIQIGGQTFVGGSLADSYLQIPRKDFDPSSPANGTVYYNNAAHCLRIYARGAWRNLQCW